MQNISSNGYLMIAILGFEGISDWHAYLSMAVLLTLFAVAIVNRAFRRFLGTCIRSMFECDHKWKYRDHGVDSMENDFYAWECESCRCMAFSDDREPPANSAEKYAPVGCLLIVLLALMSVTLFVFIRKYLG